MNETFVDVILPLALKGTFTYRVEGEDVALVKEGMRVLVPLGKQKLYAGIVRGVHSRKPEGFEAKSIEMVLDERPVVSALQLQFWNWMTQYYMCKPGEVMQAALPGGLKLSSETVFKFLKDEDVPWGSLSSAEADAMELLRQEKELSLQEVRKSELGEKGLRSMRALLEKGLLGSDQQFSKAYKPKLIKTVELREEYKEEARLLELLDSFSRTPAQRKAVELYLQASGLHDDPPTEKEVLKSNLSKGGVSPATIKALEKKGVFLLVDKVSSRIHGIEDTDEVIAPYTLSEAQENAYARIKELHQSLPVVLLQGVTSSGKTEVYIHLIKDCLEQGKQVLYLLPEIALTTQIIGRLKRHFGDDVGIFHSKYSDNERVEVYMNMAGLSDKKPYKIILGVRSAVFLPFQDLGLIIVDEEHESTYKQFDPAPRYHARDAATILGMYSGAKIVLGSATPSFESLYNAGRGKYGLVELNQRYGDVSLPEILVADVKMARKRKQMKSHFTPVLLDALKETTEAGKQAILFQNRRGYSNYMICNTCGYILKCKQCDVSLTYHKYNREMVCHYCGFKTHVYNDCPECGDHAFEMKGFGTEKIEDELQTLFPDLRIGRLDLDQMRSRKSFEKLIRDFESGRIQVLIGTQMVSKGLDFENVELVGVVDADSMLNFPDFRAFERSFQLMTQVSGRAGRRANRGKVIIQSMQADHPVIERVIEHNIKDFASEQLAERELFRYPPFYRLIRISFRHEIPSILEGGAVFIANELKEVFGGRVLGPQQALVARTHGKYIQQVLIKIEKEASFERAKELIRERLEIFTLNPVYKQIWLSVDVDPF